MPWRRQVRGDMVLASGTLGFGGRLVGWDLSICPGCKREGQSVADYLVQPVTCTWV